MTLALFCGTGVLTTPAAAFATSKADKAKSHLLAQQAARLYRERKPALAEELFRQAFALDPDPGLLYSAARAAEKAGHRKRARRDYKRVILLPPRGRNFRAKAAKHLALLNAAAPAVAPQNPGNTGKKRPRAVSTTVGTTVGTTAGTTAKSPAPSRPAPSTAGARLPAGPTKPKPASAVRVAGHDDGGSSPLSTRSGLNGAHDPTALSSGSHLSQTASLPGGWERPAIIGAWALGGLGLISGAVLGGLWVAEDSDLASHRNADGKLTGITLTDAQDRTVANNQRSKVAWGAAGVGAVAAAAGTWLWWRARTRARSNTSKVSAWIAPDGGGASLQVRF